MKQNEIGVGVPPRGLARADAPYAEERHDLIVRTVEEHGRASVGELAQVCRVSTVTIRKDLSALEAASRLVRTHGGALARGTGRGELAFEVRERLMREEKEAIGAAAADLVEGGESIAIDASTTALLCSRWLRTRRELTVITNGIRLAAELAAVSGISVVMPGGRLRWEAFSLVGVWGDPVLQGANINTAFVGAVGLTVENGLTDVTEEEAAVKRAMVASARRVVALVDHTKWGRVAFATFCPMDQIDLVITDAAAPEEMVAAVRSLGVEVRQVETSGAPRRGAVAPAPGAGGYDALGFRRAPVRPRRTR